MTDANSSKVLHFQSISYTGLASGARIIILGAVHGNETCGTKAIQRVMKDIAGGRLNIAAGSVTFVPVANPLAHLRGARCGERNLNRNLYPTQQPAVFEDHAANWLCPLLAQHEVLLDLHSFRGHSDPFVMLGPDDNDGTLQPFAHAAKERAWARHLGVRKFVDGWLDTYARGVERRTRDAEALVQGSGAPNTNLRYGVGTTEYMRSVGGYALTLECGQHDEPASPEVAYRAILNTLAYFGSTATTRPDSMQEIESLSLYDVHDKAHAADRFSRDWASFDRVAKNELIGTRHDGKQLCAERDSVILFPDAKAAPGEEWFYLAKENGLA